MAQEKYILPKSPLPGQLGIPTVAPDVPKAGSLASLFADFPPKREDTTTERDRRAVRASLSQLATQWMKYMEWRPRTMARILREVADMFEP